MKRRNEERRRNKLWKERTDKIINYGKRDKINKEGVNRNEWSEGLDQWINDGWMGSKRSEWKNKLQFFSVALVHFSNHPCHLQNSMCISQNNSYKQQNTMDYMQKPVSCSKYLVHLSKINICVNEHVSAIRMTSHCVWIRQSNGCWPRPIPCPSIVRYCNIVLCSVYIYLPVDGSRDAPSLGKVKIHLWAIYQFRTDLEKKSYGNV